MSTPHVHAPLTLTCTSQPIDFPNTTCFCVIASFMDPQLPTTGEQSPYRRRQEQRLSLAHVHLYTHTLQPPRRGACTSEVSCFSTCLCLMTLHKCEHRLFADVHQCIIQQPPRQRLDRPTCMTVSKSDNPITRSFNLLSSSSCSLRNFSSSSAICKIK